MKIQNLIAMTMAAGLLNQTGMAQELWEIKQADTYKRAAFNISPLSPLVGGIAGNFEYLVNENQGIMLEGGATSNTFGNSYSAGLGYRFHFSSGMDSGFLGTYATYSSSKFNVEDLNIDDYDYEVETTVTRVGFNVGRRWAWESGFNITARFGGGYAGVDMERKDSDEKIDSDILEVIRIANNLDGELSVGYVF